MRFPRLSHLFHRRVKSDSALADLCPEPAVSLTRRRASANGLDELVLTSADPSDVFAAYVPLVPTSMTHPLPFRAADPEPAFDSLPLMLPELKQRIRELETALELQYKANRRIPVLERALQNERTSFAKIQQEKDGIETEIETLRANLITTQRSLHLALTNPSADDRAHVLAAENATLTAERLRHRKFIELMIAVGGHKPVVDQAYRALCDGTDPESALVTAIQEATKNPDSVWASLLEPVIGPRSPEDYRAQVRCTLDARKDARTWRKRTKFWKYKAREDGAHAETVTPSPSDISSVMNVIPGAREQAVHDLMEKRGTVKLMPKEAVMLEEPAVAQTCDELVPREGHCSQISVDSALANLTSSLTFPAHGQDVSLITAGSSAVHMASSYSSSAAYSNLPPLASEIFRANMSISSSRRSSLSSLSASISRSLPRSLSSCGVEAGKASISASASGSSESSDSSARSRRRRVTVVSVLQGQIEAQDQGQAERRLMSVSARLSSTMSSLGQLGDIEEESGSPTGPVAPPRAAPPSAAASTSVSPSASSGGRSLSPTPQRLYPLDDNSLVLVGDLLDSSDDELVIIMHSDALGASPNMSHARSAVGSKSSPKSNRSQTPSPEKSRLPVLKKAIRRLSISRPVLVDTTNVATFTFATSRTKGNATSVASRPMAKAVEARTKAVQENKPVTTQASKLAASPPRPSKIPMGRRIQQAPAEFVGSARRAVQTKTRKRTGTA